MNFTAAYYTCALLFKSCYSQLYRLRQSKSVLMTAHYELFSLTNGFSGTDRWVSKRKHIQQWLPHKNHVYRYRLNTAREGQSGTGDFKGAVCTISPVDGLVLISHFSTLSASHNLPHSPRHTNTFLCFSYAGAFYQTFTVWMDASKSNFRLAFLALEQTGIKPTTF